MPKVPSHPEELVRAVFQELDLGNCALCNRTLFQVCPWCVLFNGLIFYCPMRLDVNNRLWHDHCLEKVNRRRSI